MDIEEAKAILANTQMSAPMAIFIGELIDEIERLQAALDQTQKNNQTKSQV